MTNFQHHLTEIKYRCFYLLLSALLTFCVCSNSQLELFYLIGKPFLEAHQTFIFLDLTEAFYTVLKLALVFTFVLWVPLFFYQVWGFLIPSCYKFQRKRITNYLFCFSTSNFSVFVEF
jgi:sec-independent protein translocase protein TatC